MRSVPVLIRVPLENFPINSSIISSCVSLIKQIAAIYFPISASSAEKLAAGALFTIDLTIVDT